jgi:Carboxypeptidase regulatory-like domain/TonB dependent receptor
MLARVLIRVVGAALLLVWTSGTPFAAQTSFGYVEGRVTDSTGGLLPGATVTVTNTRTGASVTAVTNDQGLYRAANLNPGEYTIRVELAGFGTAVRERVVVAVGERLDVPFRLGVQTVEESITVTADSPLVNTQTPEIAATIEARKVLELPVNSRDFSRLALFSPAAKVSSSGVATLAFNGTDIAQNNFLLDGTDATHVDNAFMSNGRERGARLQTASSESVQEFRVLSTNYSAEYGRAAGAVVTAITKSGGNDFTGGGYVYLRDDSLDARNFFDPPEQPEFNMKQFGASLGGPIKRDRVFFYTNYEGSRKKLGAVQTGTVPSQAFRATVAPPLQPLLATAPLPDTPTANPDVGIARVSGITDVTENIWSVRVDVRPNDVDNFFARVNVQDSLVDGPLFVLQPRQFAGQRQYAPIVSSTVTGSWVRTLGSNWTNEAKFGLNRVHLVLNQTDPNVSRDQLDANRGYPCTTITGVDVELGCLQDIDRTNLGLEFIDNVSWFTGPHSIKFGINFRRRAVNPFSAGYPNVTYSSLADFAANRIFQVTAEGDGGPALTYGWQYDGYIQDNWRLTKRLSLSLGLRYEYATEFREEDNLSQAFDIQTLQLTAPGAQIYKPDGNNFGPRVGATYDLFENGRTVLGGGYGIYYQPYPLQSFFGDTIFANIIPSTTLNQATTPGLSYPLPPLVGGTAPPPNRTAIDPNKKDNYNHQFTLNLQQQIGQEMSLRVAYVGNRTRNNPRTKPGNLIDPALGRRPDTRYAQFTLRSFTGKGEYDGLQLQFNRRMSDGLSFNVAYTFSRFFDDNVSPQTPCPGLDFESCGSWDLEWARSELDVPHNFSMNAIYELPIRDHTGVVGALIDGWQVSTVLLARSGLPYTVQLGTTRSGTGWTTNQRPNLVPGVDTSGDRNGPDGWLNRAAFSDPAAGTFGNLGRNTERGPNFVQLDASLLKKTNVSENQRLEFRVEVFNVLNTPIWAAMPGRVWLTASSFGRIANTFGRTESFGTARQIQLAARYSF